MFSVYFIDQNTGWSVGGPSAPKVIKSTNGGVNWVLQSTPASTPLYSVMFADANTGWAVAGYLGGETIIKTTNGGANWFSQSSGDNRYLRECFVINQNKAFAVGQGGKVIVTTNGGNNWIVQNTGSSVELWSIDFVNDTVGYAVGSNVVLKTTNGGLTFIGNQNNNEPVGYELYQNYPNPFNPVTHFGFRIADFGFVRLTISDLSGKEIDIVINKNLIAGEYKIDYDASRLASGIYFYSLLVDNQIISSKKMVLIK
jgi:photosystem II stability/assembly factor-like uncharacterized protein